MPSVADEPRLSVSALAEQSGVTVPSIKFYIREGVLPPGERVNRTRAVYGARHLSRLRLIRTLTEIGHMPLANVKRVLTDIDTATDDRHVVIRRTLAALSPPLTLDAAGQQARVDVLAMLRQLGWRLDEDAAGLDSLAVALRSLRAVYGPAPAEVFAGHAQVIASLAAADLTSRPSFADLETEVEWAVTGTLVFEQAMVALRRLAHEALVPGPAGNDPTSRGPA